jgi:hypothetical protein
MNARRKAAGGARMRSRGLATISKLRVSAYGSLRRTIQGTANHRTTTTPTPFPSCSIFNVATKDLNLIGGRLKLLRLKKCEEAFVEFLNQTIAFRKMLKRPPEPMATKEMVQAKVDEMKRLQAAVERSFADAFDSL